MFEKVQVTRDRRERGAVQDGSGRARAALRDPLGSGGSCGRRLTQGPPEFPNFVESVDEYRFVERLLPPTKIPKPPKHEHYPTPSGWQPPRDPPPNLPCFVRRSRMHNIPVYKDITHGNRQMTVIRKVEGDIWALKKDAEDFLSPLLGRTPVTQINEVTGTLRIKGHLDEQLKAWLLDRGF